MADDASVREDGSETASETGDAAPPDVAPSRSSSGRGIRERLVRMGADPDLPAQDASARISAYVYGNIITFATLVPVSPQTAETIHGFLVLLGAAVTTFTAHFFSDTIGHRITDPDDDFSLDRELRDSLPILSSVVLPCLLLLASANGLISGALALNLSAVWLLVRIASLGVVTERLRYSRTSLRGLLAGIGLALVGAAIAIVKATAH